MKRGDGFCYFKVVLLILIAVFSVLVNQSDHGTVGRPFAIVLFPMVPMEDVLQQQKSILSPLMFSAVGGWVELKTLL